MSSLFCVISQMTKGKNTRALCQKHYIITGDFILYIRTSLNAGGYEDFRKPLDFS